MAPQRWRHVAGTLLGALMITGCGGPTLTSPRVGHIQTKYPPAAQHAEAEGVVRVQVQYDAIGTVQKVTIVQSSGNAALDAEARRAASTMRIEPGTRDGVPQPGRVQLPIRFKLVDDMTPVKTP